MTVALFYYRHAVHGRAVVRGTADEPTRWIARLGHHGYFVCSADCAVPMRKVDANERLEQAIRPRITAGAHRCVA